MKTQRYFLGLFLYTLVLAGSYTSRGYAPSTCFRENRAISDTDKFRRTELYFGRSKRDGSIVTDEEWTKFLNDVVTPRFPDGFTVLDGTGQYRDKTGTIVKEPSKVLIFLYSRKTRKISSARIDEIRAAYVKLFSQESVLRLDFRTSVNVIF